MADDRSMTGTPGNPPTSTEAILAQASEETFAKIVGSSMDAIIAVDGHQVIRVFNPAAEKMFLCLAADAIGKPISILIPTRFQQAHGGYIREFGRVGATSRVIGHLKPLAAMRGNGEEFPMEASISRMQSDEGQLFTVIVRDVTHRITAEESARLLAAELESANRTLRVQIQQRHEAEAALLSAHLELKLRAEQMEQSNCAKKLLSEMGEFLQSCTTSAEASQVAGQSLQNLFPDAAGVIYLHREFGGLVDAFAKWNAAELNCKETFDPQECWAVRRGRSHFVRDADFATKCAHVQETQKGSTVCVPMMAQGQSLGVFHMIWTQGTAARGLARPETREGLAVSAAETLALAIANLTLREKLIEQTIRDPLTLLYNRRYLEDALIREISRARRAGAPVGIIMIDVDNFKHYNDSFGHTAGDELLRSLGKHLIANVRPEDIPARYGGEEFALILPGASCAIVAARAETLRNGFRNPQAGIEGKEKISNGSSISCGVAVFPEHGANLQEVLHAADQALYEAKRSGKDRVAISPKRMQEPAAPHPQLV